MEMFLWSVGSFHGFGEKLDFVGKTLPKKSPEWISNFQIDVQMQSSIMRNVAKGFYILEKGFYILEKGAHLSEERQIVQIMQIRWLDNVNHANKVTR